MTICKKILIWLIGLWISKVDLLNQQQKQAEKSYQNETKQINADYKKSINPYGYDAEAMASSGLLNR